MKKQIILMFAGAMLLLLMFACTKKPAQPSLAAPTVTSDPAQEVTQTSAKLRGRVNPHGHQTFAFFEYQLSNGDWLETAKKNIGSGTTEVVVDTVIQNLQPDADYAFRLIAFNAADSGFGEEQQFQTSTGENPPHIVVDPTGLFFAAEQNGPTPDNQTFTLTNSGGGTLRWGVLIVDQVDWLDVNPTSGESNSQTITVSVNHTSLDPGEHHATIRVGSDNADNAPAQIPVTYTIGGVPQINVAPTELFFEAEQGADLPPAGIITLTNTGGGILRWDIDWNVEWLDVNPSFGEGNQVDLTVQIDDTDLAPGEYSGTLTITSDNAANSGVEVAVTYAVKEPARFDVDSDSLFFAAGRGGALPETQSFTINYDGGAAVQWSITEDVDWLDVNQISGSSYPATIEVAINNTNLPPQEYTGVIEINGVERGDTLFFAEVWVSYNIGAVAPAQISVSPTALQFAVDQDGDLPAAKKFTITNIGGGDLIWSIIEQSDWLSATPAGGTSNNAAITVSVTTTTLEPGKYYDTVWVLSANATNSPQPVEVIYAVRGIIRGGFGFFNCVADEWGNWPVGNLWFDTNLVTIVAQPDSTCFLSLTGPGSEITLHFDANAIRAVDSVYLWYSIAGPANSSNPAYLEVSLNDQALFPCDSLPSEWQTWILYGFDLQLINFTGINTFRLRWKDCIGQQNPAFVSFLGVEFKGIPASGAALKPPEGLPGPDHVRIIPRRVSLPQR